MSFSLNEFYRGHGTRFKLFAQSPVLEGFAEPETIWVSSPRGSLGPGPSDLRMYALSPEGKKPYEDEDLPPYRGKCARPVSPGPGGHFDHLAPEDPAFRCTHMFGAVRRVLDIWEIYAGQPIPWHFSATHRRLEMIPHVPWNNAHFGWGFMEFGEGEDDQGVERPYALNFDVLAHEAGHGIVFSIVGMPEPETLSTAYRGFHESASDCVAMISALHFDGFLTHVLETTRGNILIENEMNRIGELSRTRQIRVASNALKMADVVSLETPPKEVTGKQVHKLGQPLTGAVFDILVEFYQSRLVDFGLIPVEYAAELERAVEEGELDAVDPAPMTDAYAATPEAFRAALADARDMTGLRLAAAWQRLQPKGFSYAGVAAALSRADREMTGDRHTAMIGACFRWRGIKCKNIR